jgi:protein-tyrosine phosphatase
MNGSRSEHLIDFHSHLLPGVDDGSASIEETRAALTAMREEGLRTIITTPHLAGSVTTRPDELRATMARFDEAYAAVEALMRDEFPDLTLGRGVELMLDSPGIDLSDPRVRLAGTKAVLVEFPSMVAPLHGVNAIYELRLAGWRTILAHPERYQNLRDLGMVREWKNVGCLLQVTSGSLVGRYGDEVRRLAWEILEQGLGDFLATDYHARGRPRWDEAVKAILERDGREQLRLLTRENISRLLAGEDTLPVPPLAPRAPWWKRALRRGA